MRVDSVVDKASPTTGRPQVDVTTVAGVAIGAFVVGAFISFLGLQMQLW